MDLIQKALIDPLSTVLWNYVLVYLLIGAGLYFSFRTRWIQFRLFGAMVRTVGRSRSGSEGGISSFQAFAVGLASRVGTGNIAGVAIALTLGGPGAIFWMWITALLGMATGFVEATLAQVFKVRWAADGTWRGGPAYYIQRGLGSREWGAIFAVLLIFAYGLVFNMVQANTIADVSTQLSDGWMALILMALVLPVVFGGVKRIAKAAELVMPALAGLYVLLALVAVALNITAVPGVLADIVSSAFGVGEAAAGITGGLAAALLNGVKRGLFSNEAGMGSAPNAAATATTTHPAKQGLIQSFGVFVDTIVICSATAFMILLAGPTVYEPGTTTDAQGATLTQAAMVEHFGAWSGWLLTVIVVFFAFTSILGNYSYAEVNLAYLGLSGRPLAIFRLAAVAAVGVGSLLALGSVWATADVAMALMAVVNLVAILLLSKWAFGTQRDFEAQLRAGVDPTFVSEGNSFLPGRLETDAWGGTVPSRTPPVG